MLSYHAHHKISRYLSYSATLELFCRHVCSCLLFSYEIPLLSVAPWLWPAFGQRAMVKMWIRRTNIFGAAADTSPPLLQLSSWSLWSQPKNSRLANWEKLGDQLSYFQLNFITRYPHLLTPLLDLPTLLKQKYSYIVMLEHIRIWYNRMHSVESRQHTVQYIM